jgi:hypothetical protein
MRMDYDRLMHTPACLSFIHSFYGQIEEVKDIDASVSALIVSYFDAMSG